MKSKTLSILVMVVVLASALVYAISPTRISNIGHIKTVGIEVDVTSIDWGLIEPGTTVLKTVNVRAVDVPVVLSLNTANWQPSTAQDFMSLSWDYSGVEIGQSWVPIQFQLSVSSSIVGITDFSFDIEIIGSG